MLLDEAVVRSRTAKLWVNGGITHGRGITDSTLAEFIGALLKCILIFAVFEELASLNSFTSDQHRDLRAELVCLSEIY